MPLPDFISECADHGEHPARGRVFLRTADIRQRAKISDNNQFILNPGERDRHTPQLV